MQQAMRCNNGRAPAAWMLVHHAMHSRHAIMLPLHYEVCGAFNEQLVGGTRSAAERLRWLKTDMDQALPEEKAI